MVHFQYKTRFNKDVHAGYLQYMLTCLYNLFFVDTPWYFIIAELSICKPGSSSVLIISHIYIYIPSAYMHV